MLTCSATLCTAGEIDEDRNPVYTEVELTKVYITATLGTRNGTAGAESNDTMQLFYDCYNSLPKGLTFHKGDKVIFNEMEFFINTITPNYSNGLQFYEIGLR